MKTTNTLNPNPNKSLDEQVNELRTSIDKLYLLARGRIRFGRGNDGDRGENISGEFQVISDTGTAGVEFQVAHTLGAVPVGFIVLKNNKNGVVFDGSTAWTSTNIFLTHGAANATITVFLLK